jgi:hypothetical protein
MASATLKTLGTALVALCTTLLLPACGGEEAVHGHAVAFDLTTRALTVGQLDLVSGTYGAGCTQRSSGAWSLAIAANATSTTPALTVILNDTTCVLTMTSLRTSAGTTTTTLQPISMTSTYSGTASAFGAPVAYYANAKLSPVDFHSDFVVQILYSDDPRLVSKDNTASYSVVVATSTAVGVPAPDYGLDVTGIAVFTDVNNVVQPTTNGAATLAAGAVAAQGYVLVLGSATTTYSGLETAYNAGPPVTTVPATFAASDFALVGVDLTVPAVRTLILANTLSGITSYQAFTITFHPAP